MGIKALISSLLVYNFLYTRSPFQMESQHANYTQSKLPTVEAISLTRLAYTEETTSLGPCSLGMKGQSLFERHLHPHMQLGSGNVGILLRSVLQTRWHKILSGSQSRRIHS
jgi:hypothetical protein